MNILLWCVMGWIAGAFILWFWSKVEDKDVTLAHVLAMLVLGGLFGAIGAFMVVVGIVLLVTMRLMQFASEVVVVKKKPKTTKKEENNAKMVAVCRSINVEGVKE